MNFKWSFEQNQKSEKIIRFRFKDESGEPKKHLDLAVESQPLIRPAKSNPTMEKHHL